MTVLGFIVLEFMRFLLVEEHRTVGLGFGNPCIGPGGCSVVTAFSSGVLRRVDHYTFAKFVAVCALDPFAANQAYRCSAETD